jgi:tetratricopeptide (TPR) repeat protein
MSRLQHILRTFTVIGPLLAICSISPALLAAGSGGSAPWVGNTMEGQPCRGSRVPSGPYDYLLRKKYLGPLFTTEEYHLTPTILNLQKDTTTSAINEIQYSLMTWPNHHKALYAAYQYRLKSRGKWGQRLNAATPVECHLQRAAKFSPRDPVPHMLHGLLLHDFEKYPQALQSFRKANRLLPNDVITLYNMGLTLVKLENYEEAMQVAKEVYSTDFPLQGLKNMLVRAGQWNEATTDSPADSDPAEDAVTEALPAEEEPVEEL